MHASTTDKSSTLGYSSGPVTKIPDWHGYVAWDMLFNNMATGLFLIAAMGELAVPEVFRPVTKAAYLSALCLLLADLACLVLDLGDPLRFHHMLRVFKPSSPMSLGTWCLTVFATILTVIVAIDWFTNGWSYLEQVRRVAVLAGLLPALGSATYKGVLFSTSSQPGWKDARWLGGYLVNSALMLGCAELLALSILFGQDKAVAILRSSLLLLIVLNAASLALLVIDVRRALPWFSSLSWLRLSFPTLCVGLVFPLILISVGGQIPLVLSVLFLLLGSLFIRFAIIKIPHASI
jgi:Ni/Fe-hydrogenase subunit HybB-like protein